MFANEMNRLKVLSLRDQASGFSRRFVRVLEGDQDRQRGGCTYVRYHGEVERRRHPALVNAGFLGADVSADILRPEIGGHQDAGLLLAICFRDEKIELVTPTAEFTCVHLRSPTIVPTFCLENQ